MTAVRMNTSGGIRMTSRGREQLHTRDFSSIGSGKLIAYRMEGQPWRL